MKALIISILTLSIGLNLSYLPPTENTTVYGKVIDAISSEPIIFCTITFYENENLLTGTESDFDGKYQAVVARNANRIEVSYTGYRTNSQAIALTADSLEFNIKLNEGALLDEIVVTGLSTKKIKAGHGYAIQKISGKNDNTQISVNGSRANGTDFYIDGVQVHHQADRQLHEANTESYAHIKENTFKDPMIEALSTFSIDVDRASYSNVRRVLETGTLPQPDMVRIEEMINYFSYDYKTPKKDQPFHLASQLVECPWNKDHQLLHIAMQSKKIKTEELPPSNLVFLVDVSGSMNSANKLPLVKSSLNMLVDNLRPKDRVAIVTYAGSAGVLLTPTSAKEKTTIKVAINSLGAGGSTAGAQGIITAYDLAKANFVKGGNNRVILTTDGDFNVGISSNEALEKLIEEKRKTGIYLSVCAFGTGNYQDDKMQILADKGNGNHSYIDDIHEARKVFIDEFGGTLFTVANDVKIQIEFNPASVLAYRLVGYENRMLAKEDFNDDTKDAGELGQGHSVTALYEIVPSGKGLVVPGSVDDLKYQVNDKKVRPSSNKGELAILKYRYKLPGESKSKKIEQVVGNKVRSISKVNEDVGFSVAVANFGLHLRASDYLKDGSLDECIFLASKNKGEDQNGYRSEFIKLATTAKALGLE